jgi:hypothetical protein
MIHNSQLVYGSIRKNENWDRQWGLVSMKDQESLTEAEVKGFQVYAKKWLQQSEQFNVRLHKPSVSVPQIHAKVLFLKGRGVTTVARGYYTDEYFPVFWEKELREKIPGADAQRTLGDGDGTVTVSSALPPKLWLTLGATTQEFELEHGDLINHKAIHDVLKSFLNANSL